jgi:anti-sigma28 factor (negative regulator of flagellin synthesis)
MNKAQYLEYHKDALARMTAITRAKNADYTGSSDSPFANFMNAELHAGVSTEQGFLVRMGDKMARIKSFVQKGTLQVKDESVQDTLLDLANYCILLAAYIKSQKPSAPQSTQYMTVRTNGGGVSTFEYVSPEAETIPLMSPEVPPITHERGR